MYDEIISSFGTFREVLHDAIGVKVVRVDCENKSIIVKVVSGIGDKAFSNQVNILKYLFNRRDPYLNVPELYHYGRRDGYSYIVMEDLGNNSLDRLWYEYNNDERDGIIEKVRDIVRRLKEVKMKDIEEYQFIVPDSRFSTSENIVTTTQEFISEMGVSHLIVCASNDFELCHGDVEKRNIIIKCGKIYLIDWDLAGFYPQDIEKFIMGFKYNKHTDWEWRRSVFGDIDIIRR